MLKPSLRKQGIGAVYLFGSVARETQTGSSDIDLAFDLAPGAMERFSLIDQSRIQRRLARALGAKVDLIEHDPDILGPSPPDIRLASAADIETSLSFEPNVTFSISVDARDMTVENAQRQKARPWRDLDETPLR